MPGTRRYLIILLFNFLGLSSIVYAETEFFVGYKFIPGKYNYIEMLTTYDSNRLALSREYVQRERKADINVISIKFDFNKNIGYLNLGIETGLDIPYEKTTNSWYILKRGYSTTIAELYREQYSSDLNYLESKELNTFALPLLLKIDKVFLDTKKFDLHFGISLGEYFMAVFENEIHHPDQIEFDSMQGTVYFPDYAVQRTYLSANLIGEFTQSFLYKITDSLSLGIRTNIGYLPKYTILSQQLPPSLRTAYEFGGTTYGGDILVRLDF